MPSRSTFAGAWPTLALPASASVKVVEAPPGPPVMATLLAEVYGPDAATRRAVADQVEGALQVGSLTSSTSTTATASRGRGCD